MGRDGAVAQLLDYEEIPDEAGRPDWAQPDPTRMERLQEARKASEEQRRALFREEQREQRQRFVELQGWWLQRMATTRRPLQEKLTLFWHGHFATSFVKVRDAHLMLRQNDLFRRHATGPWLELLVDVARDPAMLLWLDQAQSRKQHPNENFARELMELFTLGEGHYTEKDVTEAARAFTGWGYDRVRQQFSWRPMQHDDETKTVLGVEGPLDGNDVISAILAKPDADRFITGKLWTFFAGNPPSPEVNESLARRFRESGQTFKPLLRTVFLSEEFYAPGVVRSQVKSPVQWLVGSVRMLERSMPPAGVSSRLTKELGQELFAPPNVKGWDGGVSWITTNSLLTRYNQAALLVYGGPAYARETAAKEGERLDRPVLNRLARARAGRLDLDRILTPEEKVDPDALVAALEKRLLQSRLSPDQEAALRDFLSSRGELDDDDILGAIRLVMATPDFQLT
ncbi:MAG: DUF1800 domain-containing protein [Verrucomicrobia bacterium]|jgi:uncharacterized protein (DUF1800 family)|nr:DUF1800 domain-containing protein [Verrucomicrobiota bacterium]